MTSKKIIIKQVDMDEDMQVEVADCALRAFEKNTIQDDIATYIKKEFDEKHNPTWHCIVGRVFGR